VTPEGEYLWATPLGKKYARIDNIPFFAPLGMGDIVEIDPSGPPECKEFVRVVTRGSYTAHVFYTPIGKGVEQEDEATIKQKWVVLRDDLIARNVRVEGAIPLDFGFEAAVKLLDDAPHVFSHSLQEAIPEDFDVDIDSIPEE
jgi:hypothetical protein